MKALYDRIIVKKLENSNISKGGIFLPVAVQDATNLGEVVQVGSGFVTSAGAVVPLTTKIGDRVVFSNNVGTPVTIDGNEYIVLWEREVLAIL